MSKIYTKPAIGATVILNQPNICSFTKANGPLDGRYPPELYEVANYFPAGTELKVVRLAEFHDGAWKALVQHADGRMCYIADWEIFEKDDSGVW